LGVGNSIGIVCGSGVVVGIDSIVIDVIGDGVVRGDIVVGGWC
jgi:hypothetical protein